MTTIYVDSKEYDVDGCENILQACLSLGFDIPYFCWHPALGSIGACRQCAIKIYKNYKDTQGRLVMSCMTPTSEGTFISIDDQESKNFRKNVIEWLMMNHPHDCPICEEGGTCHLQDMTVLTGHSFRRYRFMKRTHKKQELGPFLSHEMNRCITCYRCVRYYKDYADGTDFGVYGAHENIYFGRKRDGFLESEFSGNLIDLCPTGVFTEKKSEIFHRKWDMQFAPSICPHCSIGCNIIPSYRDGTLSRIENRYNGSVNHYFLCDLGRFGYDYVNLEDRPRVPMQLYGKDWITINAEHSMKNATAILKESKIIIGIGSPRASLESNFALRELVGTKNFYTGISKNEQDIMKLIVNVMKNSGVHTPSLREIEFYDAVLVLGEDLTQTGARIALAVRQGVKNKYKKRAEIKKIEKWKVSAVQNIGKSDKYPLFLTNVDSTALEDIAAWNYLAPINEQARLGFAIAHALDERAPKVTDIEKCITKKINMIVHALTGAKKPLIITGSNAGSTSIIEAAANIAKALKKYDRNVGITFVEKEANMMGITIIGGESLDQALIQLEKSKADTVIVMENDLYRHAPSYKINNALDKVKNLIVVDHQSTEIMKKAHLILSAASFFESSGTFINQEGRAQRFYQVYDNLYQKINLLILESWRWMHSLHSNYTRSQVNWIRLDDVMNACIEKIPPLAGIIDAAPDARFRICGKKFSRVPHRSSGRTAIGANISVHELCQPQDKDTIFTFSMEGNHSPLANRNPVPFAWAPGWNSPQAWNKFQEKVGEHLKFGDSGVRLIEAGEDTISYFTNVPSAFNVEYWRVAPYYHLFGSDEMTQLSTVIQQRIPHAYVMVNMDDAAKFFLYTGVLVELNGEGQVLHLPVKISENILPGQVGFPLGFPGIPPVLVGAKMEKFLEWLQ